jgi:hypothetical protein
MTRATAPEVTGMADRRAPDLALAVPDAERLVQELSDAELFAHWAATMRELKRRGVIRTDKSPLGDFAEWLVARKYGVELEPGAANTGFDLRMTDDTRVQVKARRYTATGHTGHYGDIGQLNEHRFDEFVGVLFEEDFTLRGAWVTTWERVCVLARPVEGKHRLSIAALRNDSETTPLDLTDVWEELTHARVTTPET